MYSSTKEDEENESPLLWIIGIQVVLNWKLNYLGWIIFIKDFIWVYIKQDKKFENVWFKTKNI